MTYVGEPMTMFGGGIIAALASVFVAIFEIGERIVNYFKGKKKEKELAASQQITLNYDPGSDSYRYKVYDNNLVVDQPHNYTKFKGVDRMSNFNYDVFGSIQNPDMPVASNIRNYIPYGQGYDPNKQDYLWKDKTIGQCPTMSEYIPLSARQNMFDPTDYLRQSNSYVNGDLYYPYQRNNVMIDIPMPNFNEEYTKDPYAGIIYKNLQNRFDRRTYNPWEPARPFATYDPRTINANDPNHNPYGWSQAMINGMVNRTNYYKDYILNIAENPFGVPNDDPYKELGGPSYVGPDGRLYIHPMQDQYPHEHLTRNFLGKNVPYPTKGPEWFGWNPYGIQNNIMNQNTYGYNNISNGGVSVMSETRRNMVGPGDYVAPNLADDPYIRELQRRQDMNRNSNIRYGNDENMNAALYSKCQTYQPNRNLMNPNAFANPYANSVQNHIDKGSLVIDPKFGMDINSNDPNASMFASLLNMTPQQAAAVAQGASMPQYQNNGPMWSQYQPNYAQQSYPNYGYQQQYQQPELQSCLGPNVYAGMPGNNMVMRQKVSAFNMDRQHNAGRYMPNAGYGMNPNYGYGMNNPAGRQSVFVNEQKNYSYPTSSNSNYGMSPNQAPVSNQAPHDEYAAAAMMAQNTRANASYGISQPNQNPTISDMYGGEQPTVQQNTVFTQSFGPGRAQTDSATNDMTNMFNQKMFESLYGEGSDVKVNEPENPVSAREATKNIFGVDFGE